ncbi:UDP-gal or UDP-c-dependent glycosyltransferase, putative [Bodo saltans]|uniref:Hexosyltransferase n=1 Tax=Bodo saltans TaxID=75058 RepID=A0A0S4IZ98_BODSA|nr:UDP-gal or UDP-c-dependent glycosyltransferase, putative [Bodo saltans]|eukprot:CUG02810.1 UDP-gal or UDP-c-dependent glycosyltransferase, putative [Bodo saltans]
MRATTRRVASSSSHRRAVFIALLLLVGVYVHLRTGAHVSTTTIVAPPSEGLKGSSPPLASHENPNEEQLLQRNKNDEMNEDDTNTSVRFTFPTVSPAQLPSVIAKDVPVRDHSNLPSILVVVGIPTTDTSFGQKRREWQRGSWLRYRRVWRHDSSGDDQSMTGGGCSDGPRHTSSSPSRLDACLVVKYLIGRHPTHNYQFSLDLIKESQRHFGDMIGLEMKEGAPSTGKKSGGAGYWGLEAEVGMSRKALLWYRAALELFPQAQYIMKCDDDVFLRIPQYVQDLQSLHTSGHLSATTTTESSKNSQKTKKLSSGGIDHFNNAGGPPPMLYWGKVMKWGAVKGDPTSKFYFVGGMSITMSKDLAQRITAHAPIQEHALAPFPTSSGTADSKPPVVTMSAEAISKMYKEHNMDHEDVMIGRIIYNLKLNVTMVKDCRYHDVHKGANVRPITPRSVVIHHLNEDEYVQLFERFGEDSVEKTVWRATTGRSFHTALTPC